MKLQIQSIHFDADVKLLDFIQEKCDKLDTFYDRIIDGQVFLRLEKDNDHGNKLVEIKLNVPHEVLVGSARGSKFEEATDLVTENLKRQLKRYKEKMREKDRQSIKEEVSVLAQEEDEFAYQESE